MVDHIKRCYLIPVAAYLAPFPLYAIVGHGIDRALSLTIFIAASMLFCIGIAESILAIINRRTVTSTVIGTAYLVFAFFTALAWIDTFVLLSAVVGIAGAVSAFFNGRTATAIVSGIAVIVFGAAVLVSALGFYIPIDLSLGGVILLLFFTGSSILAVAFITHTNMALAKLKALYLIPPVFLVSLLFYVIGTTFNYQRAGYDSFTLFIVKQALLYLLPLLIAGSCITMGINRIIDSNAPNIAPHKDSLKL